MPNNLVIVESPAKAKTIKKYLGKGFDVEASLGHVKDLPKSQLGVDIDNDFETEYVVIPGKEKVVAKLKKLAKDAAAIYLAPDPDREGEAIAAHLAEELGSNGAGKKKKKKRRMPAFLMKLGGLVASEGIRAWMSTLDYRAVFYDRTADPVLGIGGQRIYIFWHENILLPLYLRGHCNLAMLLSQHPDAEILARVAHHMGFDCVRGSTSTVCA